MRILCILENIDIIQEIKDYCFVYVVLSPSVKMRLIVKRILPKVGN